MHKKKIRILVLSWHPESRNLIAGGFVKAQEILKRRPKNVKVLLIDKKGSLLRCDKRIEYSIPRGIIKIRDRSFILGRVLEWFYVFLYLLYKQISLNKYYDVVYIPTAELTFLTLSAVISKLFTRKKIIADILNIKIFGGNVIGFYRILRSRGYSTFSSLVGSIGTFISRKLLIWSINNADKVLTISKDLKKDLTRYGVKKNISVIPVGIDIALYKKIKKQKKIYDAIFIGRHTPEKGIFDLIDVWKLVVKKKKDAKLVMAGLCDSVTKDKLKRLIKKNKLEDNVFLMGEVTESSKIKLLKQSKTLLFLSHIEGWGIVPFEGLACGLPVIAYNLPVYKETIKECKSVFLFKKKDYANISKKVVNLSKKYSKYRFESISYVKTYSWDKISVKQYSVMTCDFK